MYVEKPILPGWRVLIYCRFSTEEQRSQSIDAQRSFCERFLRHHGFSDGEIIVISDEGLSGELRSRPGIDEVRQMIASRRIDLLISEDSSRLYRDVVYAGELVGTAVDMNLRVICINDEVDTCRKDWRKKLIEAQQEHTQANERTRARLSRTIEELWFSGAAIGLLRPGYRRVLRNPSDRRSPKVDEIDPQWPPIVHEAFMMAANRQSLEQVGRFLTDNGLPKFANSSSKVWNERNVLTLIRCELYKGVEFYRAETSRKSCATGKMRSVPNPEPDQVLQRDMPHLDLLIHTTRP